MTRAIALGVLGLVLAGSGCRATNPAFHARAETSPPDAQPPVTPDAARPPVEARPEPAVLVPGPEPPPVDAGRALPPDAAPDTRPPGPALMVVGYATLLPSDLQMMARLLEAGFMVTTRVDADLTMADVTGKSLIVISGSVYTPKVMVDMHAVPVPVVCMDSYLFPDLRLTGSALDVDYGDGDGTKITIVNPGHVLAAGLTGTVEVAQGMIRSLSWGVPSDAAIRIASLPGDAKHLAVFAYQAGAIMAKATPAPARRVALFLTDPWQGTITDAGLALFSAAVRWAMGQ
jgi:hypothetical protein